MNVRLLIAIVVMGFSGLVAEIILLREFLIVFAGNELAIGIILANWMVLEAFGSFVAGGTVEKIKHRIEAFTVISLLFSLALFLSLFGIRLLKSALGISIGEGIGFWPMLYASFILLLPASVLHGALFTFSCRIYAGLSGREAAAVGKVYIYETVGTLIGGLACTYLLIPYLDAIQAALGLALLNVTACLALTASIWQSGLTSKVLSGLLGGLIVLLGWAGLSGQAGRLHRTAIQAQWRNQHIVHYENSPYGNICILENQGQYIFFQDGSPTLITPVPDMALVEEFVHLPLLIHPQPADLFILSGGAGGVIDAALKHPSVAAIAYAELDPLLPDLLRQYPTPLTEAELTDPKVAVKAVDGRLLLETSAARFDVILIGIMEPSNLQTNRLFTREFFTLARQRLQDGGLLVIGLPGSMTYLNDELKDLNACIYHTLLQVFDHIRIIPGDGRNLFIASDAPGMLTVGREQLIQRLGRRNLETDALLPWHIENKLHRGWQDWFARLIADGSRKINSDFRPMGLFYSIAHWNALFAPSLRGVFEALETLSLKAIAFLSAVLLLVYFIFSRLRAVPAGTGIPLAVITTGFAGMLFDLMIIFTFQSIYGYVFSWIGVLVAAFMTGTAVGAALMTLHLNRIRHAVRLFLKIDLLIIAFALACPFLFHAAHANLGEAGFFMAFRMLFLVMAFTGGILIGAQFPLANKIYLETSSSLSRTAGLLYAADLLGGWLGGIFGAVVLLPVLGLIGTGVTVAVFKLASAIILTDQSYQHSRGGRR
jgi:spermidine synthase